jgi:UDP-4-amino-4,6-dideoxy-N-acetyl-beta-L-altrosamine transaminase
MDDGRGVAVLDQKERSKFCEPVMIPYGRQSINQSDIQAVIDVLNSDFLTQGPKLPAFEHAIAQRVGAKHALAVNSATSALHIACLSLGLGPGDHLWTTPITFIASANCGLYCGAKVDFVDIDAKTYNLCPNALESKLIKAERAGTLPKILVTVHFCGQSCDMAPIRQLSDKYGFKIIEDASHALGGLYEDYTIGSCRYSEITVFSFHPVKLITTGEGGVAVTNCSKLRSKMDLLRNQGITRDQDQMHEPAHGPWYYEQLELGYNYRMTELQAALGTSQLLRLDEFILARESLAARYDELLKDLPLDLPFQSQQVRSALHLYVVRLKTQNLKHSQSEIHSELRARGIGVNLHYIPIHLQPYYRKMGFARGDFPEAERYYQEALSLPIYPSMTFNQQDSVIATLHRVLELC